MQTQKRWLIGLSVALVVVYCSLCAFLAGSVAGGLVGGRIGHLIAQKEAPVVRAPRTAIPPAPTRELPGPVPPRRTPPGREMRLAAVVITVAPDGPADEAGIRPGDAILAVDDQEVSPTRDLKDIVQDYEPGDRVRLTFLRDGQKEGTRVRLGRRRTDDGDVVASLGLTYRLAPAMPSW
jgi:membrane-associated protease RseP (regulator of RpoE activity)